MQGYVYFGEVGPVVKAIALALSSVTRLFKVRVKILQV